MAPVDIDVGGKLEFADLALKLLEIVMKSAANNFLFDFHLDPLEETLKMNSPT